MMSLEGMIERMRLGRIPDDTTCTAVIVTGTKRYEQDRQDLHVNVRTSFPEFPATDEVLEEWADRIIKLWVV